jgi:hypothetical protein
MVRCNAITTAWIFYMSLKTPHVIGIETHSLGGMILTGKTEELGQKPTPVPLCQHKYHKKLPGCEAEPRRRSDRPRHGTASADRLTL